MIEQRTATWNHVQLTVSVYEACTNHDQHPHPQSLIESFEQKMPNSSYQVDNTPNFCYRVTGKVSLFFPRNHRHREKGRSRVSDKRHIWSRRTTKVWCLNAQLIGPVPRKPSRIHQQGHPCPRAVDHPCKKQRSSRSSRCATVCPPHKSVFGIQKPRWYRTNALSWCSVLKTYRNIIPHMKQCICVKQAFCTYYGHCHGYNMSLEKPAPKSSKRGASGTDLAGFVCSTWKLLSWPFVSTPLSLYTQTVFFWQALWKTLRSQQYNVDGPALTVGASGFGITLGISRVSEGASKCCTRFCTQKQI